VLAWRKSVKVRLMVVWYLSAGTHGFATRFGGPRIGSRQSKSRSLVVC
jgi:hypothetical protein